MTQRKVLGYFPDSCNVDEALLSPEGRFSDSDSVAARILDDAERIKTVLLYFLCVPLVIVFTVLYPILVVLYLAWTEVILKAVAAISSRKHA